MNNSFTSALLSLGVLLAVSIGCSQGQESGTANVTGNTTTASTTPATGVLEGSYDISGMNENGAGAYKGTLIVTPRGDVYQFSWDTAGRKYDGVGVRTDNSVAAAFASGDNGEGCGVVLYKIGADGTLDGKAGYWGNNSSETEVAKRTAGTDLEGDYEISGNNTAGQNYTGKLSVKKAGAGYTFSWNAGSQFEGFGIKQDDTVAVGIGGSKCGFVSYEIAADGTLNGKWGGYGSRSVGTETAKKK